MYIAHQIVPTEDNLSFLKQIGVERVISAGPVLNADGCWALEDLLAIKDQIESAGLELVGLNNIIGTPGLRGPKSGGGVRGGHAQDQILLAGDGRDAQIDRICQSIRNAGQVGIGHINYGFILTGVWRTGRPATGRGGATVTAFDYEMAKDAPLTEAGEVEAEEMWERFEYFLKKVIPVAEEAGVNMACHPHDPPPKLAGDPRILGSVEGYKRLIETVPSERNGLNFCQGTVAEMGTDVVEAIHYFGSRNKIFNVHFRNIRGTSEHFQETFVDDGDVDMMETLRAYHEVGYTGPVVPDHLPNITVEDSNWGSLGYALGYMKGMLRGIEKG